MKDFNRCERCPNIFPFFLLPTAQKKEAKKKPPRAKFSFCSICIGFWRAGSVACFGFVLFFVLG